MTVLQDIRDAVIAVLNKSGKPDGVPEFTKRRWTPEEELSAGEVRGAVLFHREASRLSNRGSAITVREHALSIQFVTAVAEPDQIDDALEPAREWIVARLGDSNLDGLVHDLVEGETVWETAMLGRWHGACTVQVRANYQTKRDDLTLRS